MVGWLKRRIVVPKIVGSNPISHPIKSLVHLNKAFSFISVYIRIRIQKAGLCNSAETGFS